MFESLSVSAQFRNSIDTALRSGTLSHALILEGSDSKTRLEAAKEITAAVLCEGESKPCRNCIKCRKVQNGSHPDVHILEKDPKSNMIKVDPIRELKKKALVYPNDGDKTVFIINDAEFMNPQAQNALLKIFEEPAKHLLFILCCGAKSSLLDTVISRATAYSLGEGKKDHEKGEKAEKAFSLARELSLCLAMDNELEFMKKSATFIKDKDLFRLVLKDFHSIMRDCIILQNGGKELLSDSEETARKLSSRLTAKKAMDILHTVSDLYDNSMANSNHNLTVTRFSALLYDIKTN